MSAFTIDRRIKLLTARQLSARIDEVESYLRDITSRSSRYKSLHHELRMLRARHSELTDPTLGL